MSTKGPSLWMPACALAVVTVLAYLPSSLSNGFVFDDFRFVAENPHVAAPESWLAFFTDASTADPVNPTTIVRPLRTLEFALDHALFGASPAAFHLHSVLWHALGAALAFLLLRRLIGDTLPALVGAAIWALHPMQVESVAWISSRGDVAMGACTIAALLCALRAQGRDRWFAASLALGAVAMLYKETAIVLPLLIFALRLWVPERGERGSIVGAARSAWPWLIVSAVYLLYRSSVMIGGWSHTPGTVLGGSTAGTFATMFRAFGFYLLSLVAPVRPAVDWYMPESTSLAEPAALSWLAVHATLAVTAVRLRRARPGVTFAICLFYFPLLPVANWPVPIGIPTSERFLLLPLLGLAVAVALGLRRLPRATLAAGALLAASFCVLSMNRATVWDNDRLWDAEVATHDTPRGHAAISTRRFRTAREMLRSLGADTPDAEQRATLARALELLREARDHGDLAVALWVRIEQTEYPARIDVFELDNNLASICTLLDEPAHALAHATRAERMSQLAERSQDVAFWQPSYNRAIAFHALGMGPEALRSMQSAFVRGATLNEGHRAFLESVARLCESDGRPDLAKEARNMAVADAFSAQQLATWRTRDTDADAARQGSRAPRLEGSCPALGSQAR